MDRRRRNRDFPGETVDSVPVNLTRPSPDRLLRVDSCVGGQPLTHGRFSPGFWGSWWPIVAVYWNHVCFLLVKLMTWLIFTVHLDPFDSTATLGTGPIGWSLCSRATCFVFNGEIWHFILFCWSNNFLAVSDQTGFISMRVFRLWYLQMMKQDETKIFCGKTFSWLTIQPFSQVPDGKRRIWPAVDLEGMTCPCSQEDPGPSFTSSS